MASLTTRAAQVEKDVIRTDRDQPHLRDAKGAELARLRAVLLSYVMYNQDLGYCQGMSDVLSPLILILPNEAEARASHSFCVPLFSVCVFRVLPLLTPPRRAASLPLRTLRLLLHLAEPVSPRRSFLAPLFSELAVHDGTPAPSPRRTPAP